MLVAAVASAALPTPSPKEIVADAKKFDGTVGIYAKNLRTGQSFGYNEDAVFAAASTSKLVVTLAVYKYMYATVSPAKKELYDRDVEAMITVSDNDAFAELLGEIDAVKPDALKRVGRDLRLTKTQIHSEDAFKRYNYHSVTTAHEMANVMETIYRDRYLGKARSNDLKDKLANTIFKDEIPRYMETRVMHKAGELDNVLCDVGIVDDGKDQILISAYTSTGRPTAYASDYIATASAKLYNLLRRK
jgi:beta-lactamase class A